MACQATVLSCFSFVPVMQQEEQAYRTKQVKWPPWASQPRTVPILLQDINGPCPLIAILNVMLLRGTLTLPAGVGEVAQTRAIQLLAEHLLDSNFAKEHVTVDEEATTNLQQNLSDAIGLLPKLTTGIDINVRFDGIRRIEYTGETAVFDLLGIDLVHGWLVDPQDRTTAAAVGSRSYNELILNIVATLGRDATPAAISRRTSSLAAARQSALVGSLPKRELITGDQSAPTSTAQPIDAVTLSAALASTLQVHQSDGQALVLPDKQDHPPGPTTGAMSTPERNGMASAINSMLADTVKEAFATPPQSQAAHTLQMTTQDEPKVIPPTEPKMSPSGELSSPKPAANYTVEEAILAQEFLESNPSQLTVFGLASLFDGIADGELAVFFRNNHFNVLLRSGSGLYLLITDQGYLFESDIVWEHLSNVDGDTELLGWDLRPFKAHASKPGAAEYRDDAISERPASAGLQRGAEDADFALALQLQQEEEAQARDSAEQQPVPMHRNGRSQQPGGAVSVAVDQRRKKKNKDRPKESCCIS